MYEIGCINLKWWKVDKEENFRIGGAAVGECVDGRGVPMLLPEDG